MAKNIPNQIEELSKSFCGKHTSNSIFFKPVQENEIEDIISYFNSSHAAGVEDIPVRLIKSTKSMICPYV